MSDPIYQLRPSDVYAALETTAQGLPLAEVRARQSLYGPNALQEAPPMPHWRILLRHATEPIAILLLIAGAVALIAGRWEGLIIWGVVAINGILARWQERQAERDISALKKLLPIYSRVARDSGEALIPSSELVPGDVLVLAEGDNIPADARVVEEFGLRVNNATLTGEAIPARRLADASLAEGLSEIERPNLIFAGTSVTSGTGRAVIYATGMGTQFGRIASLAQFVEAKPSPLHLQVSRFTRIIALVAIGLGILMTILRLQQGQTQWSETLLLFVGLVVAAVPEGLLPILTLSLASSSRRLAKQGILVKAFSTIEPLGNISVICTDKSGTLTTNQMTVRKIWTGGQRLDVTGVGYEPAGEFFPELPIGSRATRTPIKLVSAAHLPPPDLDALLVAAALANNSRLNPPGKGNPRWNCLGDQTEAAMRVAALKGGADESQLRTVYPRIHELPFDARRKRMSTIHRDLRAVNNNGHVGGGEIAFVKGAPNEILARCTHILFNGEERLMDEGMRAEIDAANDAYAQEALRVLALARRAWPVRSGAYVPEQIERDLTFLGLMAMSDPPRPEVAAAIETCRQAGIRIVMITGDYGLTAEAIARRVGILDRNPTRILTGAQVEAMSDAELQETLNPSNGNLIFARMSPEHKLRAVGAMQTRGEVVAVIGDGVNDAPALRKSDIGIAMGITGTEVAKEAADIVLTDDNFSRIVLAIREGRTVYANLRKAMTYIFASNVAELAPFVITALLGLPLALTVAQVLLIDLVTDLLPALALGAEPPEPTIMQGPPQSRRFAIADNRLFLRAFAWLGLIETILCFIGYFLMYSLLGHNLFDGSNPTDGQIASIAAATYFAGVIASQVGNAFACRSEDNHINAVGLLNNPLLIVAVLIEMVIAVLSILNPVRAIMADRQPAVALLFVAGFVLNPVALYGLEWLRKVVVRYVCIGNARRPAGRAAEVGEHI